MFKLKFKRNEFNLFTSFQKNVLLHESFDYINCEKEITSSVQEYIKVFGALPGPNSNFIIKISDEKWMDFSVGAFTFFNPNQSIYLQLEINYMDTKLGSFAPVNKQFYSKDFLTTTKLNDFQKKYNYINKKEQSSSKKNSLIKN